VYALSYMGTKRWLAGTVGRLVHELPPGPLLDAFAGMCAVGRAVAPGRQLWTNDILTFPTTVARALLTFRSEPPLTSRVLDILQADFLANFSALRRRYDQMLAAEDEYISMNHADNLIIHNEAMPHVAVDLALEKERQLLARDPTQFPYRLVTITYAGGYFGLRQSFELDSFRFASDRAKDHGHLDDEQWQWCLLALGAAASRVSNSTGHFAQFLRPTVTNSRRILAKRRRSIRSEFVDALKTLAPIGSREWRRRNRVFQANTLDLLIKLYSSHHCPAIVFADPPYSRAQYSRYYHVLDTLIKYDYPSSQGIGRYPLGRFATPFSHASSVQSALDTLIADCRKFGATLLLSYPDNGLLFETGVSIDSLLRRHYKNVDVVSTSTQSHSSFGGPKAAPRSEVVERLYLACV
jgi:adenine-specific DNA-methyltransferase